MKSYILVDEDMKHPFELVKDTYFYYVKALGKFKLYGLESADEESLAKTKVDLGAAYNCYKFELHYGSDEVPTTLYTENLITNSTLLGKFQGKFADDKIIPVANTVLERAYNAGNLKFPVFLTFGEPDGNSYSRIERNEIILLSLSQFATSDYDGRWEVYPRTDEVLMLKYGNYEKIFDLDVKNNLDNSPSYYGEELHRDGIANWVHNSKAKIIGLYHSNFNPESDFCKEIITEDFWENFILAQILDENVYETFMEPIIDVDYSLKRFVFRLTKAEKDRIKNLTDTAKNVRDNIEESIRFITQNKIKLISIENDIVETKNTVEANLVGKKVYSQVKTLLKNPIVKSIEFSDAIDIITHPILIDGVVPIGGYTISLGMGKEDGISITNNENKKDNFDHPHVCNGKPCWGNYTDVYVHLANKDIISTAEIIFQFLASWNPEDTWGKNLIRWDPRYAFETFEEMNLMETVDNEWATAYYEEFGESLPNLNCPHCGYHEEDCYCHCPNCGDYIDDGCDCDRCENCGELIDDCNCERCRECDALEENCECEICGYCDENITAGNCSCEHCDTCGGNLDAGECTCERCEDCGEVLEECTCEKEEELEEAV